MCETSSGEHLPLGGRFELFVGIYILKGRQFKFHPQARGVVSPSTKRCGWCCRCKKEDRQRQ